MYVIYVADRCVVYPTIMQSIDLRAYFVKQLCSLKVHLDKRRGESAVSDDPTCWICFANTQCTTVHLGCRCAKTVHLACAAKWFMKSIRCFWRGSVLADDWVHDYECTCEVCHCQIDKQCLHFFVDVLHRIKGMRSMTEQEKKDTFYACILMLDCDACGAPKPIVKKVEYISEKKKRITLYSLRISVVSTAACKAHQKSPVALASINFNPLGSTFSSFFNTQLEK